MARRFLKNAFLGSVGAVSLLGLLSGGISMADSNCAECDLLRAHRETPTGRTLGHVGSRSLQGGINIASLFSRARDFDRRVESPMMEMLDPARNPYLASAPQPTEQAFLFAPWASFTARPQVANDSAVLFPTRVQPFWNVSQGYAHLNNTTPWATPWFGNTDLAAQAVATRTLGAAAL